MAHRTGLTRKAATETLSPGSIAHEPRAAFVLSRSGRGGGGDATGDVNSTGIDGSGGGGGGGGVPLGPDRSMTHQSQAIGALAAYSMIGRSLQSARQRGAPVLAAGGTVVLEVPPDRKLHRAVKLELVDCGLVFVRELRDGAGMRRGLVFRGAEAAPAAPENAGPAGAL